MKATFVIDENKYPVAWRFNSKDCQLSVEDKKKIIMLGEDDSELLWDAFFPFEILMQIDSSHFEILEKKVLDFDDVDAGRSFFQDKLRSYDAVIFFWGRRSSALISSPAIIVKAWDDFFYPGDESSLIYIPNDKRIIFSYEETFFLARTYR
ncbi:hypothetical protein [Kosakonia sp. SMBL-WEM22]|uniref:hypothetical protein n=1 Tax=Kosakonia sp. SMBL-WEM22 TaxID=2725560 RepID=UPI0016593C21|nr:hypothetical protein [Kosakonia sp. SMBL-WEM22]MDV5354136.1 hypothetical protein [Enterobacter asburiae]